MHLVRASSRAVVHLHWLVACAVCSVTKSDHRDRSLWNHHTFPATLAICPCRNLFPVVAGCVDGDVFQQPMDWLDLSLAAQESHRDLLVLAAVSKCCEGFPFWRRGEFALFVIEWLKNCWGQALQESSWQSPCTDHRCWAWRHPRPNCVTHETIPTAQGSFEKSWFCQIIWETRFCPPALRKSPAATRKNEQFWS